MKTRRTICALALTLLALAGCGAESADKLVASGKSHASAKDYTAALIQFKNALQKAPDNAEARYLLGITLIETGDPSAAEIELKKALALKYPADLVYPALGRALLAQGQPNKVIADLSGHRLDDPAAQAELEAILGEAHLTLGRPKEAREAFNSALGAKPDLVPARLGLARLLAADNDLGGALALVDQVLAKTPQSSEALNLKARILEVQGQPDEAVSLYEKAVAADPRNLTARQSLVQLLMKKGRLDRALTQIEEIQKIAPGSPTGLYLLAAAKVEQKDFAGARDSIQQVLKAVPDHLPSLYLAGLISYRMGSFEQAENYLRRVLDRAPNQIAARRLLVATYLASGDAGRAQGELEPLLRRAADDPAVLGLAGEVYLAKNELSKAGEYYEKLASLQTQNAAVRTRLGQIHFATGQQDRAIQDLDTASAMSKDAYQADLTLITAYLMRNQPDKALEAVTVLEKKQPDNPLTHTTKGMVLLAKKDIANAQKSFERALELRPTYLPAVNNLALIDLRQKKPDSARKRYEAVLAKEPGNEQALVGMAQILRATGAQSDEIASTLKKAVSANPASLSARLTLIQFLLGSGDVKTALTEAQAAAAALPDRPEVLDALGTAQLASGDYHQAIASFTKLAQNNPGSAAPLMRLASAHLGAKDDRSALEALRKALEIDPNLAEAHRRIVGVYAAGGRFEDGLAEARAFQKRRPEDPRGYLLEGDLFQVQKKWTDAEKAYRKAYQLSPNGFLLTRLHGALLGAGRAGDAEKLVDQWIRDHPEDAVVPFYLAQLDMGRGDFGSAVKRYKSMLSKNPNNPIVLNNLAFCAEKINDPDALSYAERAYSLAPNSAAILDTLGWMLIGKGETARGTELLARAVDLAPNAAEIRLHYAKALVKSGSKDAARKELQALSKMDPDSPIRQEAAKMLGTL